MQTTGKSEKEIVKLFKGLYGGVDKFLLFAEEERRSFVESLQDSVPKLGRKPRPGEQVTYAPLGSDLAVRIFAGDLNSQCFFFDFVDKSHRYMCKPSDVRIVTEPHGFNPEVEVLSMEESVRKSCHDSRAVMQAIENARDILDKEWETFIMDEGTLLRFERGGERFLVKLPTHVAPVALQSDW